jgi:hypothetical protein
MHYVGGQVLQEMNLKLKVFEQEQEQEQEQRILLTLKIAGVSYSKTNKNVALVELPYNLLYTPKHPNLILLLNTNLVPNQPCRGKDHKFFNFMYLL